MAAVAIAVMVACSTAENGKEVELVQALDDSAWQQSEWISVADAPVVTDTVVDGSRVADGASWFLSMVKNDKPIASARWMTTALGMYEVYVNGQRIGDEILKPGFTHWQKTRRSFTYDITPLLQTSEGSENVLSAEVTPGWWANKMITPWGHKGFNGRKCEW